MCYNKSHRSECCTAVVVLICFTLGWPDMAEYSFFTPNNSVIGANVFGSSGHVILAFI